MRLRDTFDHVTIRLLPIQKETAAKPAAVLLVALAALLCFASRDLQVTLSSPPTPIAFARCCCTALQRSSSQLLAFLLRRCPQWFPCDRQANFSSISCVSSFMHEWFCQDDDVHSIALFAVCNSACVCFEWRPKSRRFSALVVRECVRGS